MFKPVVVVPGTFWKDVDSWAATYARENQPMRAIAEIFGVTPHLFDWCGSNSAKKRHAAAIQLAEWIRAQHQTLHLVGFSHGGNVACEAAALLANSNGPIVDLLVTIATPFTGRYQTGGSRRHLNLYSPKDRMQIWGGEGPWGLPKWAQRRFPDATNIAIEGIASDEVTGSHGNILWSEETWTRLAEHTSNR